MQSVIVWIEDKCSILGKITANSQCRMLNEVKRIDDSLDLVNISVHQSTIHKILNMAGHYGGVSTPEV